MANLSIDSLSGDLVIGRSATRVSGVEYTAQLLKARIKTLLGEWEQDTSLGIDWFGLLDRGATSSEIERSLRTLILQTVGVKAILNMELTPDYRERELGIAFTILSTEGITSKQIINI